MSKPMNEGFIPFEQIEPLLRDGMTGAELKAALCGLTGLDPKKYRFVTRGLSAVTTTFRDALRSGLYIERFDTPDNRAMYLSAHDERVR